ncbi:MAG TPA: hypothetical protein VGL86_33530, partial [Polyangia bacterium]
ERQQLGVRSRVKRSSIEARWILRRASYFLLQLRYFRVVAPSMSLSRTAGGRPPAVLLNDMLNATTRK